MTTQPLCLTSLRRRLLAISLRLLSLRALALAFPPRCFWWLGPLRHVFRFHWAFVWIAHAKVTIRARQSAPPTSRPPPRRSMPDSSRRGSLREERSYQLDAALRVGLHYAGALIIGRKLPRLWRRRQLLASSVGCLKNSWRPQVGTPVHRLSTVLIGGEIAAPMPIGHSGDGCWRARNGTVSKPERGQAIRSR